MKKRRERKVKRQERQYREKGKIPVRVSTKQQGTINARLVI